MTGFSYTDNDGAVFEMAPEPDGSLTVTTQGVNGPILCIAIPVGERPALAAAARPPVGDVCDWERYDRAEARAAVTAGGQSDG